MTHHDSLIGDRITGLPVLFEHHFHAIKALFSLAILPHHSRLSNTSLHINTYRIKMKFSVLSILVTVVAAAALPTEKPNKGRYPYEQVTCSLLFRLD